MAGDAALGGVTKGFRRVLIAATVLGAVGLVVAVVLGHYVAGLTLCVGIALGLINTRLTLSAAARFSTARDRAKRPIIFGAMQRLAAITVVALLVAYAFRPDGVATLIGLALYQLVMVGNTSRALFSVLRKAGQ